MRLMKVTKTILSMAFCGFMGSFMLPAASQSMGVYGGGGGCPARINRSSGQFVSSQPTRIYGDGGICVPRFGPRTRFDTSIGSPMSSEDVEKFMAEF